MKNGVSAHLATPNIYRCSAFQQDFNDKPEIGQAGTQCVSITRFVDQSRTRYIYTYNCVKICVNMATNLDLDNSLILRAQKAGKHKTKKETVTQALIEYAERREQRKIKELFGSIEYDESYDYKAHRSRK